MMRVGRSFAAGRFVPLGIFLMVLLATAACGNGDEAVPELETPAIAPTPTPLPTPFVEDGVLRSPAFGYRARAPEGWTVVGNFLTTEISGGDALFAPEEPSADNPVKTNIAVVCQRPAEDETLASFVEGQKELLQSLRRSDLREVDREPVAGTEARQLEYRYERGSPSYERIDVFFSSSRCMWTISLTTRPGERETFRPLFEEFLRSFQVEE